MVSRRTTAQQQAVRSTLSQADGFISASDLRHRLNADGDGVGLATVYRQLNALVDMGRAHTLTVEGSQLFRSCGTGEHHHHLVCEMCRTAIEIAPPSESWIQATAVDHGFSVMRHVLEVFGRCAKCESATVQLEL